MEFHPSECSPTPRNPTPAIRSSRASAETATLRCAVQVLMAPLGQGERSGVPAGVTQSAVPAAASDPQQNFFRNPRHRRDCVGPNRHRWRSDAATGRRPIPDIADPDTMVPRTRPGRSGPVIRPSRRALLSQAAGAPAGAGPRRSVGLARRIVTALSSATVSAC
jgi:hypothetical protein